MLVRLYVGIGVALNKRIRFETVAAVVANLLDVESRHLCSPWSICIIESLTNLEKLTYLPNTHITPNTLNFTSGYFLNCGLWLI